MSNKTTEKYGKRVDLAGEVKYVRLGQIEISPMAQRELNQHRVIYLQKNFDPDLLGHPRLSFRDGRHYAVDGQHRVEACKGWLGPGWEDVSIECIVVKGMTEQREASYFLSLNDVLPVHAFQRFKIALTANRSPEIEIATIVESVGLKISHQAIPGAISCVTTLLKVYKRDGPEALRKALVIAKNAFGDAALIGKIIDGLGLLANRYNGMMDEGTAIKKLGEINGGFNGLINAAQTLRIKTGLQLNICIAASAVKFYNHELPLKVQLSSYIRDGNAFNRKEVA